MPQLINSNLDVVEDNWELVAEGEAAVPLPSACFIALSDFLNADKDSLPTEIGVWLSSADSVEDLVPHLDLVTKVACKVENFMDGRNFSQARILREQNSFTGSIRAVGSFIQDQLFFLKRCGFDEFELRSLEDKDAFSQSLNDFNETYQAACDNAVPLFRRRG